MISIKNTSFWRYFIVYFFVRNFASISNFESFEQLCLVFWSQSDKEFFSLDFSSCDVTNHTISPFTVVISLLVYQKNIFETFVFFFSSSIYLQKQLSRCVHKKRCSENMQKVFRRTPMPNFNFNKVAKQLYWNYTSAWVFSCEFATDFQNTFL